jgi:hypothetical protein
MIIIAPIGKSLISRYWFDETDFLQNILWTVFLFLAGCFSAILFTLGKFNNFRFLTSKGFFKLQTHLFPPSLSICHMDYQYYLACT